MNIPREEERIIDGKKLGCDLFEVFTRLWSLTCQYQTANSFLHKPVPVCFRTCRVCVIYLHVSRYTEKGKEERWGIDRQTDTNSLRADMKKPSVAVFVTWTQLVLQGRTHSFVANKQYQWKVHSTLWAWDACLLAGLTIYTLTDGEVPRKDTDLHGDACHGWWCGGVAVGLKHSSAGFYFPKSTGNNSVILSDQVCQECFI